MLKKPFIVFEGPEGGGKSSNALKLKQYLTQLGYSVLLTKEPGGDDVICQKIRSLLLDPAHKNNFEFRAEFLLFEADRAQHVARVIVPALADNSGYDVVISDRYDGASYAYQCIARDICLPAEFEFINTFATRGLKPTMSFWLDLPPNVGLIRNKAERKEDRFEKEELGFHEVVREGYTKYYTTLPKDSWVHVDATLPLDVVNMQIIGYVDDLLKKFSS